MKIEQNILFLGLVVMLLGCNNNQEQDSYQKPIAKKTQEALGGEVNGSGCNGDIANENQECSEDDGSSSSFILSKLEDSDNNTKENSNKDDSLRTQLDDLIQNMSKEKDNKKDLEELVEKVENIAKKDSKDVAKGIEDLVDSYDKENNSNRVKEELTSLVEEIEDSKNKREKYFDFLTDEEIEQMQRVVFDK